ncbi:MAG TPA: TlpA disulfide reductase family protein [Candidatus Thermoplasmatota archaeon]|nr:TlpA disulfide reductase family protein [Candidatus Thermoplasmatota archaeon]
MNKVSPFFVVFLLILLTFFSGCTEDKTTSPGDDFSFTTLDGETKYLTDYRGKVVILDMWATWCSPCQIQMLELRKIYENYSKNDVEILSIDIDQRETAQQIHSFLQSFQDYGYDLTWVFGIDGGSIWETYQVGDGGIPAICIFDREGILVFSHEGLAVYDEIPPGYPVDLTKLAPVLNNII